MFFQYCYYYFEGFLCHSPYLCKKRWCVTQCSVSRFFLACPKKQLKCFAGSWLLSTQHSEQEPPAQCCSGFTRQGKPQEAFNQKNTFSRCNSTWEAELCFTTTRKSKFFKPGHLYTLQVLAQTLCGRNKTFGGCQDWQLHRKANSVKLKQNSHQGQGNPTTQGFS